MKFLTWLYREMMSLHVAPVLLVWNCEDWLDQLVSDPFNLSTYWYNYFFCATLFMGCGSHDYFRRTILPDACVRWSWRRRSLWWMPYPAHTDISWRGNRFPITFQISERPWLCWTFSLSSSSCHLGGQHQMADRSWLPVKMWRGVVVLIGVNILFNMTMGLMNRHFGPCYLFSLADADKSTLTHCKIACIWLWIGSLSSWSCLR